MGRTQAPSKPQLDASLNPTATTVGDGAMQYLCLIYQDDNKLAALSDSELDSMVGGCIAWTEDLEQSGHHVLCAGLQSVHTAMTVRNRNGKVSATDGPFAETKEHLGGFTIIRARDLNEAIRLLSEHPCLRMGSTFELRPINEELTERLLERCAATAQA